MVAKSKMKKIWKYVAGFFTLLGGILIAFLSGKGAGKKAEKLKGLKKESKKVSKRIKEKEKKSKSIKKNINKNKKDIEKLREEQRKSLGVRDKNVSSDDINDYLKKYSKGRK